MAITYPISLKAVQQEITGNQDGDYALTTALTAAGKSIPGSLGDFNGYESGGTITTTLSINFNVYLSETQFDTCNRLNGEYQIVKMSNDGVNFVTSFCSAGEGYFAYGDFGTFYDISELNIIYMSYGGYVFELEVSDSSLAEILSVSCIDCSTVTTTTIATTAGLISFSGRFNATNPEDASLCSGSISTYWLNGTELSSTTTSTAIYFDSVGTPAPDGYYIDTTGLWVYGWFSGVLLFERLEFCL